MIVVDTNVLAHFFIQSEMTALARQLYDLDPQWIAPSLLRHEFINVLAVQKKTGYLSLKQCEFLWRQMEPMMQGNLVEMDLFGALELAVDKQLSVYDAQFVVLSKARGIPLITEDRELCRKFSSIAFTLETYLKRGEA